ncbi:amidohydrolase [Gracilibacillus salinarum]|uniref:Amidohydrolase n=1 Tax=Gracilibacillus salinarum TaxID=2932255 RepID=A0ABY4GKH7_9BACI|nr:amidohydrolase [Gracilibacillus salinarum]UOQ84868.1 amidohydrolase [Gracilibacillus salinarum]
MKEITLLFKNANVLTLDKENHKAGSVAVADGRIVGVWEESEPPAGEVTITDNTNVIDLQGATLLPGFVDTHNHILMSGTMRDMLNCSTPPNETIEDLKELIAEKAENTADGEWIVGFGYDDTLLAELRHPTRADLDPVSPNHPVILMHASGHLAVANSAALELAGLADDTKDPESGGHFGRDSEGKLNGVLYEAAAQMPVRVKMPQKTEGEMIEDLRYAAQEYVAQGITTNSDAAVSTLAELEVHTKAAANGINPMRTQLMIMHFLLRDGQPYGGYTPEQIDQEIKEKSNGLARLDSAKMFQDGSIQGLTGALRKPYYQNPGVYGDLIFAQEDLNEEVLDLHKRGFRITTHGNGDRAIGSIIDAYENAIINSAREDHKHRIEHVQSATTEDIENMARLGIAGSFFINHVYFWGDRHENIFLGPDRGRRISPLKDAVDNDLLFTLHSDCPVTPISPLFSVWAAVNRTTSSGKILGPEQRIDVITALKSMTIYGAELIFDEENVGSIEIGKCADFAVLEEDPTSIAPEKIKDIKIQSTYIDGKAVYENKELVTN